MQTPWYVHIEQSLQTDILCRNTPCSRSFLLLLSLIIILQSLSFRIFSILTIVSPPQLSTADPLFSVLAFLVPGVPIQNWLLGLWVCGVWSPGPEACEVACLFGLRPLGIVEWIRDPGSGISVPVCPNPTLLPPPRRPRPPGPPRPPGAQI